MLHSTAFVAMGLLIAAFGCADLRLDSAKSETTSDDRADTAASRRVNSASRQSDIDLRSVTGDIVSVSGLDSVVPNQTEDNSTMFIFREQSSLALPSALGYDVTVPGSGNAPVREDSEIPAGTEVDVYFVHFDPVGSASKRFKATIAFPHTILGLQVGSETLDAGDALVGRDDVEYPEPGSVTVRGLELGADKLAFDDKRTLSVDFQTSTSSDQMRVITSADD